MSRSRSRSRSDPRHTRINVWAHSASYFRGVTPDIDDETYEAEYQKALRGESNEFLLVGHKIYNKEQNNVKFVEVLLRGGRDADTAPVKRILSMTEEEKDLLMETTLRKFGHMDTFTMNILNMKQLGTAVQRGTKMILEIHESLIEELTVDFLQTLSAERGFRFWADDCPFNRPSAIQHIKTLLPGLDGVKISTPDLAKAFQVPLIKNPIDKPAAQTMLPANSKLRDDIIKFLEYLSVHHPSMKVVLELDIPLEALPGPVVRDMNLFIQGGPDGARAYHIERYAGNHNLCMDQDQQ